VSDGLKENITNFLRYLCDERNLTFNTCLAYERDLKKLIDLLNGQVLAWSELTSDQLRSCLIKLKSSGLSHRSLHRWLSSIRHFLRYLNREGVCQENPASLLQAPKQGRKLPKTLDADQVMSMLDVDSQSLIVIRDHAMVELFYSSGLRLSELVYLDMIDLDLNEREVRITGKGNKERILPVGSKACNKLIEWIKHRANIVATEEKALFVSKNGSRISRRQVQNRLKEWGVRNGLGKHLHPHMLRHSFASHMLESSGELRSVQELLGHSDISSTQMYTHLDFQHLAQVYDKTHPRAKKQK